MKTKLLKIEEGLNLDCVTLNPEILGEIKSLQEGDETANGVNEEIARLDKLFNFLFEIYYRFSDEFAGDEKKMLDNLTYITDLKKHFEIFRIKQTSIVENFSKEHVSTLKIVD